MNIFKDNIDKQIAFNSGKNLFFEGDGNTFRFIQEIVDTMGRINEIDEVLENRLIDYTADRVLQEFCRVNQYYSFNTQGKSDLRDIYVQLFSNIKKDHTAARSISSNHYKNLKKWLLQTNAFSERMYLPDAEMLNPVACSEYAADLQLSILGVSIDTLKEPILDIGCGLQGHLVLSLREKGLDVFGFDRFMFDDENIITADWHEFDYGVEKWGTITSNLGFSNHFKHHHHRESGDFLLYAKTYMAILNSLKVGGAFHYAPEVPFIEQYLDASKYLITKQKVGQFEFKSVTITRLMK